MKRFPIYLIIAVFAFSIGISAFFFFGLNDSPTQPVIISPETVDKQDVVFDKKFDEKKEDLIVTSVFQFARKPSKQFRNIQWIWISNATAIGYGYGCARSDGKPCGDDFKNKNMPKWKMEQPKGIIATDKTLYNWKAEKITIDEVSFTTETIKGMSYKFSGQFTQSGIFNEIEPQGVVLKGRLTKLKNDQISGEEDVEFLWRSWADVDEEYMTRISESPAYKW